MIELDEIFNNRSGDPVDWYEESIPNLGFRIWHVIFMAISAFLALIIFVCCCIKFRVPRTKQEIEADYQRKLIAKKFRERLRFIQNQDMDNLDLKSALERVRRDFITNTDDKIDCISQADSTNSSIMKQGSGMKAEPQQERKSLGKKLANVLSFTRNQDDESDKMNKC